MPLINVKIIEGVFSESQKRTIVERLTDAMVSIEGENLRPVTWVVIDEVKAATGPSAASLSPRPTSRPWQPAKPHKVGPGGTAAVAVSSPP